MGDRGQVGDREGGEKGKFRRMESSVDCSKLAHHALTAGVIPGPLWLCWVRVKAGTEVLASAQFAGPGLLSKQDRPGQPQGRGVCQ